jgi:redox-sensitive bicupin YhaK (pirin superfamily)
MATCSTPQVDVRRAGERYATRIGWLDSKHSFSFGHHYDPGNTHFGLLLVNNDDVVAPARASRRTRTATWRSSRGCCRGQLVHQDSEGHSGVIYPGSPSG